MGRIVLVAAVLLGAASPASAQRTTSGTIPGDVSAAIATLFNAPETRRERGVVNIARDSVVSGTLAVRGGPVKIAGRITGNLVVVNADVTFLAGARVDSQVFVVGGTVEGRDQASIGGDFRAYSEILRYTLTDGRLVVDPEMAQRSEANFWGRRRTAGNRTTFDVFTVTGNNAYNRVEGFPILLGPRVGVWRDWGSLSAQVRAIVRTARPITWDRSSIGHDARFELRWGQSHGIGVGGAAFDRVDAIESWSMSDHEAALAAAGIRRDYRDYYGRHGTSAFVSGYLNDNATIKLGYSSEDWQSLAARNPWSLFRNGEPWRANPQVDEGRARLLTAAVTIDTRNQTYSPGAGWYVRGDIERGRLEARRLVFPPPAGSPRAYVRGFLDARRYNRLAPGAQLNVRMVLGGWMSGGELPVERRLSLGGPFTLPGFDFREYPGTGVDRLQCLERSSLLAGLPVMCDRIALMQVEYRGDLSWSRGDDKGSHWWSEALHAPTWIVFADAGRGWRAHLDGSCVTADCRSTVESFPALSTFRTDLGVGLDFGSLSVSLAKSMSDRHEPMNVIVRLSRRF